MHRDGILVVDANERRRDELVGLLREARYYAEEAATPDDAHEFLSMRGDCGVIIAEMDEAHEFALLDTLVREQRQATIVAATDRHDVKLVTAIFRRGAADLLLRPLARSEVLATVDRALEINRQRRQTLAYRQNLEELIAKRSAKLRATMSDLELSYDITIEAMGDALDLRDEETEGHSKRVTAYTIALARELRLPPEQLKTIARGAFLHDIGKIAIPDAILLKPARLTEEEAEVMKTHCEKGYATVRKIPFLADAAEIVYAHQECFDGSGYPRGLRGEAIPLGARIFAIADTLDAITSDRPYRRGRSFADAIAEIRRCSGTQFDPEIVDVFLAMSRETWPAIKAAVGRHSHAAELVRAAAA